MGNQLSQVFPPKPLFTIEQIPDLSGQVIIVTGGNAGVGKETCKALLNKNAKVYLAARSKTKADEAIEWLKKETGKEPIFLELDLANLDAIKKTVEEFKRGVMMPPVEQKTANGYDLQFGTNVLGHFYLTTLLLPILIHSAKNSPAAHGHARVVNTASSAINIGPKGYIVWETLGTDSASDAARTKLGTGALYAQSKIGNVLFSNELAKRYGDQGIVSVALNPGNLKTELQRHMSSPAAWLLDFILYPASQGALTQSWAGIMPESEELNGKYLFPWARVGDAGAISHDEKLWEKLWSWCEEQVKAH